MTRPRRVDVEMPDSLREGLVHIHDRCVRVTPSLLAASSICFCGGMALADEPLPLLKRLDDPTRAKVLSALAGLIILGFAMVLLTWLAARVVHRYRHGTAFFRPTIRPGEHEWAKKPLIPPDSDSPDS